MRGPIKFLAILAVALAISAQNASAQYGKNRGNRGGSGGSLAEEVADSGEAMMAVDLGWGWVDLEATMEVVGLEAADSTTVDLAAEIVVILEEEIAVELEASSETDPSTKN
ncbi:uncharacterized protein LOC131892116 [Tigriopus californicus]|uniref:uncharacterized protein LOC131892116 n=1 Tax=Tigriopus californicus TaxID=6832 RepID=UPI0027DA2204|nr:uncharacterized protein LOC131892116 [Tigriopus californicus]